MKRKIVAGTVAALAVGGAGAGVAATQFRTSPSEESKAVISDAAKKLGVQPSALSNALKQALKDRVDAAVAAGRLTKAQGNELKQRIDSNDFPLFPGPPGPLGFGHERHHLPGLTVAPSYLDLTVAQVEQKLESGKTLAQIAKDEGKSVDGLIDALKADLKSKLDDAVKAGRLTKAQEDKILADAEQRITAFVNGKFLRPPPPLRGGFFGERRGFDDGPHAEFPGA